MLKKYKIRELSKDLEVTSKEIVKLLKDNFGGTYSSMTSLSIRDLDFIFEYYTKKNEVTDFNEYFKLREEKSPLNEDSLKSILDSYESKKENDLVQKENKNTKKNNSKTKPNIEVSVPEHETVIIKKLETKSVDTRSNSIDINKYDKKYDEIAQEQGQTLVKNSDVSSLKQKISRGVKNKKFRKRESESERLKRIENERKTKPLNIKIPDQISVTDLALRLKATVSEVVKKLISLGVLVSAGQIIDFDTASLVAMEFNAKVEKEVNVSIEDMIIDDTPDSQENLVSRPPIVVVMGHVDHGKTSILDYIRKTNVASGEHGGITQHIGAYKAYIDGKSITFLDTPGHEAFTSMRARGAKSTDIAVLVVAADDGIMPQTIEAINHAKDAKVSIVVAINKIDKPGANVDKVKQQLMDYGLVPEEWGGDVICVPVSAKTGEGISELLNMITLTADMLDLKANPNRLASGVVIDSRVDRGRGVVCTVLVMKGTLKLGDTIISGTSVGKVRSLKTDTGKIVKSASLSDPIEITGLDSPPFGGEVFNVVKDEHLAKQLASQRKDIFMYEKSKVNQITSENIFDVMNQKSMKEFKLIIKADVNGSVEALKQSLEKLSDDKIKVKVIHSAVGAISESDVMLAKVSGALIIGFNVRPDSKVGSGINDKNVKIRMYRVIYDCIDDMKKFMEGLLEPELHEVKYGTAECIRVFNISGVGVIAGCSVSDGKIIRGKYGRVIRDGVVKSEDVISSLQRSRTDAKEVGKGFECGILFSKFSDLKIGDVIECYSMES